jgi:hypothetical protein
MAGRYRALLIGNSTYPADEHNLQTLKGPVKDIAGLNRALIDPGTGLFVDVDVTLLPEATSTRAIRALGRFFRSADRDDVLLFYFSGHGKLDQDDRLHLCMQDTESTDLLSTAVSSTRVNEFANASHARIVVIVLDCCYAGAFRGGELGESVAGPGRYVLASCRGRQLANDATVDNGTSFFTQHLIDGLLGAAPDQDGDGYITFSELYAYVDRRLRGTGKQIPQRHVHGDGDVRMAKRPQPPPKVAEGQPSVSEEARPPYSPASRLEQVTLPAIPPRESKVLTLAPLYSFGMLSSLPFIVWFVRTKRFDLVLRAVLYLAASTAFIIWSSKLGGLGLAVLVIASLDAWYVSVSVTSQRLRVWGRDVAERMPDRARELRIGRPDLLRTIDDGGLVDLNSAPSQLLVKTPLKNPEIQILLSARTAHGRFSDVADLERSADLDPKTVRLAREYFVFL